MSKILPKLDFKVLFESTPGNYLILLPNFTIVAISDAYEKTTETVRENIVGKSLFEVFPNDPDDLEADGVVNLTNSLKKVLDTKESDTMPVQKYNIQTTSSSNSGFESRFWSPLNCPVLEDNQVTFIIHSLIDVTEKVMVNEKLTIKAKELERTHHLMVDRELRMIELKKQIEMLKEKN